MSDSVLPARPGKEAATPVLRITFASVNCYLVTAGAGFVLVDSSKPENVACIDPDLGCRSREQVLALASQKRWAVGVSHFSHPLGSVGSDGWRGLPLGRPVIGSL